VIFGINSFTPEGRGGHVAVIVNDTIYFMGGSLKVSDENLIKKKYPTRGYNLSDEVFSLDLTSSFSRDNPPFIDLSGGTSRMLYGSVKGTAVLGGAGRGDVYLVGGTLQNLTLLDQIDHNETISNESLMLNELINTWNVTDRDNKELNIFVYRPTAQSWKIPDIKGGPPIRRRSTSTVISQNGTIYIFGGRAEHDTGSPDLILFNDTYIYNTVTPGWNKINASNAPSARSHSTATLLPNGKILYIGGVYQDRPREDAKPIEMNDISVFDTNSLTWSSKACIPIQARIGHTATLTPDNNAIIIIGGTSNATTANPVFIMLDIRTEPYEYSELKDSGIRPPTLAYHTVNLYQNFMIVAFGNITNDNSGSVKTNPSIYLLCLPRLEWVTTFTPDYTCPIIPNPPIPLIIGSTVAFYVVFIATTVAIIKINRQSLLDNKLMIIANCSIALIALL
ncbi:6311_t:CDS:2, partial [Racocetra persica]